MTPALIVAAVAALLWCWFVTWIATVRSKEIDRLRAQSDATGIRWINAMTNLQAIADATRDGKSGTARKVHRMAVEALK